MIKTEILDNDWDEVQKIDIQFRLLYWLHLECGDTVLSMYVDNGGPSDLMGWVRVFIDSEYVIRADVKKIYNVRPTDLVQVATLTEKKD